MEGLFQEALGTATQSLEIKRNGLGADGKDTPIGEKVISKLTHATWDRVFVLYDAIQMESLDRIHKSLKLICGFCVSIQELYNLELKISEHSIKDISKPLLLKPNKRICRSSNRSYVAVLESEVYNLRNEMGVKRVYKLVDTCAAEFQAQTPYYYSTFEDEVQIKGRRSICRQRKC